MVGCVSSALEGARISFLHLRDLSAASLLHKKLAHWSLCSSDTLKSFIEKVIFSVPLNQLFLLSPYGFHVDLMVEYYNNNKNEYSQNF